MTNQRPDKPCYDVILLRYDVLLLHYPTQTPVLLSGSRLDRQWFLRLLMIIVCYYFAV